MKLKNFKFLKISNRKSCTIKLIYESAFFILPDFKITNF